MKAFVVHEIPQGLGKKSLVMLPYKNGCLVISAPYDRELAWFETIVPAIPEPEDDMEEITLPDDLVKELFAHYENKNRIDHATTKYLRGIVIPHLKRVD